MSVVRKTFTGTLSETPTGVTHTITGLTSESSTTNVAGTVIEATLHFLDALYQTLLDAGHSDTIKNENDYSITVLGFKFFVICIQVNSRVYPKIYTCGNKSGVYPNGSSSSSTSLAINSTTSPYTNLSYNILVRGDTNHVSIYLGYLRRGLCGRRPRPRLDYQVLAGEPARPDYGRADCRQGSRAERY